MSTKLVLGPFNKGVRNDVLPFNIDNNSFPNLINAYQWRGRVKRKRGTEQLGRLTRFFDSTNLAFYPAGTSAIVNQVLNGSGAGNLRIGFGATTITDSAPNATIVPGSVRIHDQTTAVIYTDPAMDGTLSPGGTINYSTGAFVIAPGAADTVDARFKYFPDLPVMGLEDLVLVNSQFPGTLAFDTVYSYNINTTSPFQIFDVSFYKNPASGSINGITYTQKTNWTPTTWNGQDYQQFWSTNYQGAFWTTNGINVPFSPSNVGMQYKPIASITYVSATELTITITEATASLVVGDWVFINEVLGTDNQTVNFQTGFVTASANVAGTTTLTVRFPYANIQNQAYTAGILQYLTNRSDPTKDSLRWFDGLPINNSGVFQTNAGWVNFAPPLIMGPNETFSIGETQPNQYYLVGARMIVPFKDRLLFLGPVIQTSATGSQIYLQDTVIYSQNGSAYYTSSFDNTSSPPFGPQIFFQQLLTPGWSVSANNTLGQSSAPNSYWEDVTGFGGFIQAGFDQSINTVVNNEDVLLIGFTQKQTRLIYTGDDLLPFNFFTINSELGSTSTFSAITLDRGALTVGPNGIVITSQVSAQRIDLEIPDQVFQFNLLSNGIQRVTAQRDFINEWIYFTYSPEEDQDEGSTLDYFPAQTLLYNYRDASWAIFNESYTTYGQFRKLSGQTWDDLTKFTWDEWTDLWDSGEQTLAQPEIIGGNQQGFVMIRSEGTGEDPSGYITNIDGSSVVTSPHHNLKIGDFIVIDGVLGTLGGSVNGRIFSVANPSINAFTLNPTVSGTYLGGGVFTRMYVPFVQTKQFPVSWEFGRKTRIGAQQYLLSTTNISQITLLIFLSENPDNAYNIGPIVPDPAAINNALVYSTVLFTCPESTNLGLTSSNTNLQMLTATQQAQIWHRINTSLIGDTVQLGITLSDAQMRTLSPADDPVTITNATQANPCILTAVNSLVEGELVQISNVLGMTQLNGNVYFVLAVSPTSLTIQVDSTGFSAYISGGLATPVAPVFQFDEIELHGVVMNLNPSQMLS